MKLSAITSRFHLAGVLFLIVSCFFVSLFNFSAGVVFAADDILPREGETDPNLLFRAGNNEIAGTVSTAGRAAQVVAVLVNVLTTIVVSAAFLFFFWQLVVYIKTADNDKKEEAKTKMTWSILAMVVITSLWGIIAYVRSAVGIDAGTANIIPIGGVEFF